MSSLFVPRRQVVGVALALTLALLGAGVALAPGALAANCSGTSTGVTPLNDLGAGSYRGYTGGLYPGGSNVRPTAHDARGVDLAEGVTPRAPSGAPDEVSGKIVFVSIGMSNTLVEFEEFRQRANADVNKHPSVVVFNGAEGGETADRISDPADEYWDDLDQRLSLEGLAPAQVQAVWVKEAISFPTGTFPQDATTLQADLRSITGILKDRFPNLWLVYLSSRIYAGYATTALNPEPYAYQGGFAVKWLIQEQIAGGLPIAAREYPWLSWGPYLWADGTRARSDGLSWACMDFGDDGTHPSQSGINKVAGRLFTFVHSDPTARTWYENGGGTGPVPPPSDICSLTAPLRIFGRFLPGLCTSSAAPVQDPRRSWRR